MDSNAVAAGFAQPDFDGTFQGDLARYLYDLSAARPVLFFAFAPKAAGTFLRSAAVHATGGQLVRVVYAQGGCDAHLYMPVFIKYFLGELCEGPLIAHVHMQALPANRRFLEVLGIRPVIMIRSITDMLASYRDMLDTSETARAEGINCTIPRDFAAWPAERKSDFLIEIVAPWYVGYFATWLDYARVRPAAIRVLDYAEFSADPAAALQTALDHAGLPRSREACRAAIDTAWADRATLRFNKGAGGRGKDYFSQSQRDKLSALFRHYPALGDWCEKLA
ncbi:MAG TPA: hypothetical protein VGG48_10720 [Rhizomicrobium sp.]|jgi:hypothetical protein